MNAGVLCVVQHDMSSDTSRSELDSAGARIVANMTACQSRLYAYICTMMGTSRGAADVLQEANLVLWLKSAEYDPALPFMPWAMKIAYFQVLAHRKKQSRDRLVFDDALMGQVEEAARQKDAESDIDQQLEALDECLDKLPPLQKDLVDRKYLRSESVNSIAATRQMNANAVSAQLYRLRKALTDCVEKRLGIRGVT